MTGTIHGYMIYRLQKQLVDRGYSIPYTELSNSLTRCLMNLDEDMEEGEYIQLPTGRELMIGPRRGRREW